MRKYCLGLLSAIILLASPACREEVPDPEVLINLPPEFMIFLWEELTPDSRRLDLKFQSAEAVHCEQSFITARASAQGYDIEVVVDSVVTPAECTDRAHFSFGHSIIGVLPEGNYNLYVDLKNTIVNSGQLRVTPVFYELKMTELNGIQVPNPLVFRVPEGTIWGYIAYNEASSVVAVDSFFTDLAVFTQDPRLYQGEYGYFRVDKAVIELPAYTDKSVIETFAYRFTGTDEDLQDIIDEYRNADLYPDLELKIFTSEGEEY